MDAFSHIKNEDLNTNLFKVLSFADSFYFKSLSLIIVFCGLKSSITLKEVHLFWNQVVGSILKAGGEAVAFCP